jgi:cathepsin F/cysteine peptidase B
LRAANPLASFGINKFSDLSVAEFRSAYLMPTNSTRRTVRDLPKFYKHKRNVPAVKRVNGVATDVDWCAEGMCTAVKNQEQCGSCWAFSATQVVESANAIAGKGLNTLSPQQIVDCDTNGSDQGCNGGDPRDGIQYLASNGGLDTESSYPYTGVQGTCSYNAANSGDSTTGPVDVSDGDENALQSFLQSTGPPSVCVDASSWSSYTGGVLTTCGCNVDHAVQATGISSQFGTPAYIIRNSWASDWGVNGFIYLAIGSNTCCVANEVSWANV